jgi:hypothetical protein
LKFGFSLKKKIPKPHPVASGKKKNGVLKTLVSHKIVKINSGFSN